MSCKFTRAYWWADVGEVFVCEEGSKSDVSYRENYHIPSGVLAEIQLRLALENRDRAMDKP